MTPSRLLFQPGYLGYLSKLPGYNRLQLPF